MSDRETLFPLAEKAEIVARTIFAKEWESLAHTARVVATLPTEASDEERAVAWLHDVVEDTHVELVDLLDMGFPGVVVQAVDRLSRTYGSPYVEYKALILNGEGPAADIARTVKLADARENLDRCERAINVPKWQRLAEKRYRPLIAELEAAGVR